MQTWKTGKSFSFVDEFGVTLTGVEAETKLLIEFEKRIGTGSVIGTYTDEQGRFLVQFEGVNQNSVIAILKNKDGNFIVNKFERAYKPSANPNIPVPLSVNKLAPDFANSQYLYPIIGSQKNIVKIKMSGYRNSTATIKGDFELANIEAGFGGKTAPKFIDSYGNEVAYTWHHLDDFDPLTGECTMQLVRSDAHTGVRGMTHSGSVAQYKAYNGSGY
ncbi:MAG: HNH endonuclease [Hydrotalea flava]|nr:HNH endonuclease [Hydrotalea flava]